MRDFGWDLPPGVSHCMLPGNGPEPECCMECEREECLGDDCPELNGDMEE